MRNEGILDRGASRVVCVVEEAVAGDDRTMNELPRACPKCRYGSQMEHCTADDVWDGPGYARWDPPMTLGEFRIRGECGPGVSSEWLMYACRRCRYELRTPCADAVANGYPLTDAR